MNTWLNSTVRTYIENFGRTREPVVWEVGSRDGDDGVELAQRIFVGNLEKGFWDAAHIVAFEPNPEQSEKIRHKYPKIEVFEWAAGNEEGEADFMVYHGDAGAVGSSSLHLTWKGDDLEGHIIRVRVMRLDSLITDEQIDIMKIDVEGYSLQVLEGLGDKLNQIKVLHVETENWNGSDKAIERFMKQRGFKLCDVMEQYGGMPDQVWLNRSAAQRD